MHLLLYIVVVFFFIFLDWLFRIVFFWVNCISFLLKKKKEHIHLFMMRWLPALKWVLLSKNNVITSLFFSVSMWNGKVGKWSILCNFITFVKKCAVNKTHFVNSNHKDKHHLYILLIHKTDLFQRFWVIYSSTRNHFHERDCTLN